MTQIKEALAPQIIINHITQDSWADYEEIRHDMLFQDQSAFPPQAFNDLLSTEQDWRRRINNGMVLLAYEGNTAVAMVRATFEDKTAVARNMYTRPSHRGTGLGKLLMQDLIDRITSLHTIETIELEVEDTQLPAIRMYEKFGFREIGRVPEKRTIHGVDTDGFMITMRKPLIP